MFKTGALAALMMTAVAASVSAAPAMTIPEGLWVNPHNSVVVRTGPCGAKLCGWVVWGSRQAKEDARDGGVADLLGTELLQDYGGDGPGAWSGTVFVPDKGRHFASTIQQLSPASLKISGCILGGLICKSQVWNRIERLPGA
ncbi:DUF2147 domain-containing protein [Sphingomonas sp.]|uniref:DUF2147 domain-containing protein n=1 Tax=Sphingomonas sp. TaxID=28214 RepID=UPI003B007974